uniref:Uncharacterized protein n=1 Tax=Trypanosoma vivax (strain Y486) TaxID=1055687 RepID=G0U3C1_TRYVY|nr:hypothetical protein TVY486_0905980 [Trypanosoma vivax Y486]
MTDRKKQCGRAAEVTSGISTTSESAAGLSCSTVLTTTSLDNDNFASRNLETHVGLLLSLEVEMERAPAVVVVHNDRFCPLPSYSEATLPRRERPPPQPQAQRVLASIRSRLWPWRDMKHMG